MNKKKVVLAIFTLQGNGAERFALTMAKAIVDSGHEAHVVYFKDIIELPVPDNIPLHFFNYQKYRKIPRTIRAPIAARAFDKFVYENVGQPDLVLSNLYPVDLILARSRLSNVHLILHNTFSQEYADLITPKFIAKLKATYLQKPCIAVSKGVEEDFRSLFGAGSMVTTVHNPVDVQAVTSSADAFIPEYHDYIVHVGKFKAQKRHDILIKAYAQANLTQPLLLIGTGELLPQARALVKSLNLEDKVVFMGYQFNPYPFIKNATLMVVSSDFEGFSIAILEALALGTPVISTDCPSGPSEVLPAQNLVAVRDIDALSKLMRVAAAQPDAYTVKLEKDFYPKSAVQKYLQLTPSSDAND